MKKPAQLSVGCIEGSGEQPPVRFTSAGLLMLSVTLENLGQTAPDRVTHLSHRPWYNVHNPSGSATPWDRGCFVEVSAEGLKFSFLFAKAAKFQFPPSHISDSYPKIHMSHASVVYSLR
jgi:hypothetical protein